MKIISGWSDCPDKIRKPIVTYTEEKVVSRIWFRAVSQKDAKKLVSWWNQHTLATYQYEHSETKGLYNIIQHKKVWF